MITKERATDKVMDALGDSTRRNILALLRETAMPVGDIAGRLPVSRPAVSRHLRILESAGLVEYTSSGTRNIFRLKTSGFEAARNYLEGFWDKALENFRLAVEEAHQVESEI